MHLRRTVVSLIFALLIVYTYEKKSKTKCEPANCNIKSEYLISDMFCRCHAQIDLAKVVCFKLDDLRFIKFPDESKSFNVTVNDYSPYLERKFIVNGLNNDIQFEFLSIFFLHCFHTATSLLIVNFCPVNSEKSMQFNLTEVIGKQRSNLEVLYITNSCVTSLTGDNEKYFFRLKELHLSFNRLIQIPEFKSELQMLRVLDVSNNFISSISKNNLKFLTALQSLNISYNHISVLPKDLLIELNLKVLDLSHNFIFKLPFVFKHIFHLERLYLNNNNFTILPEYFFNYTQNLIHLDLSNNKLNKTLQEITTKYKKLRKKTLIFTRHYLQILTLESIYLNNVGLSDSNNALDFGFSSLNFRTPTLKIMSLTYNGFTRIPLIHIYSRYTFLDLRWNKITTLDLPPTSRTYDSYNVSLDVSHNCIQIFDTYLSTQTEHNYLSNNTILYTFRCSFCCLKVIHPLMFFNLRKLLDLSHNMITELNLIIFSNDQPLTINVSHNQITHLLNKDYEQWSKISLLDISYNNLISLVNLSVTPNLDKLYLNNNSLSEFYPIIESLLSSNATDVRLAGNPWNCNCKIIPLIIKSPIISDKNSLTCVKDGLLYHMHDINRFCSNQKRITDLTLMWLLIPISIIVIIIIAFSLYFKFKSEILYFMFSRGMCLKFVSEKDVDNDKIYDAFISYCHEDEDWVADFLMTGLETGTPAYKLCLHNRDWLGGEYIPDQIVKSVESSRRTIIVLTENFVKSNWSRMEFDIAYQQTVKDKIPRLIVVLPGDVPDLSEVSNEFKTFVKLTTYIQASKPYFWRKLRASMPRTMNLWENKQVS